MKKILIIIGVVIILIFSGVVTGLYIWTTKVIKRNIVVVKSQYPGTAEDALIAYMQDPIHTPSQRSHIAIWTLGQIESKKAIPILKKLYKNDPLGRTCYRKHDSLICQYEIYKALHSKEVNWFPLHPGLNK